MRVLILAIILTEPALLTCQPFDISAKFQCRQAPEWSAMVDELRRFDA